MKNLKVIVCFTLISMYTTSCQNSNTSNREKDLDQKERELNAKEDRLLRERENNIDQKEREIQAKNRKDNNSNTSSSSNSNASSNSNSNSNGEKHIAVINDPDGYTNVRNGMSTDAKIIDRLFEGEHYEVFPSTDNNWWVVYTQSNVKGYVHKSRVRIID
jgi:hypothetical protein